MVVEFLTAEFLSVDRDRHGNTVAANGGNRAVVGEQLGDLRGHEVEVALQVVVGAVVIRRLRRAFVGRELPPQSSLFGATDAPVAPVRVIQAQASNSP